MAHKPLLFLALPLLLASCAGPAPSSGSSSQSPSSESTSSTSQKSSSSSESQPASSSSEDLPAQPSYVDKEVLVHYQSGIEEGKAKLRYYEGSQIAYISLKDYVPILYKGRDIPEGRDRFDLTRDGSAYTSTVAGDYTAIFDTKKNSFHCDNLLGYKGTSFFEIGPKSCITYDGLPFIQIDSYEIDKEATPVDIAFADYRMNIYGDKENVYVPFSFLSDLFTNDNMLQAAYNGEGIYVVYGSAFESLSGYGASYYENMFNEPIKEDYAAFLYNEICLDYDHFLGRPGRSALEKNFDLSEGLDAALEKKELGKHIKALLRSTEVADYLAGVYELGALRADGGHTNYNPLTASYRDPTTGQGAGASWLMAAFAAIEKRYSEDSAKYSEFADVVRRYSHEGEIAEARAKAFDTAPDAAYVGEYTYHKIGHTAFITFDDFIGEMSSFQQWKDYYAGTADLPYGEDKGGCVLATFKGLEKARNDNDIETILFDLPLNTGGSTDEMLYLISMLTGKSEILFNCRSTQQNFRVKYKIDRNLDKVFDEKDDSFDPLGGKKVGVLTSPQGFSCGGICIVYLNDYGIATLGNDCGGGSCSVYEQTDAYGLRHRSSSPSQIFAPVKKISVDEARIGSCAYKLETKPTEADPSKLDFSSFYDEPSLNSIIKSHYQK